MPATIAMLVIIKAEEFVGGNILVMSVPPTKKILKKGIPGDNILITYQC